MNNPYIPASYQQNYVILYNPYLENSQQYTNPISAQCQNNVMDHNAEVTQIKPNTKSEKYNYACSNNSGVQSIHFLNLTKHDEDTVLQLPKSDPVTFIVENSTNIKRITIEGFLETEKMWKNLGFSIEIGTRTLVIEKDTIMKDGKCFMELDLITQQNAVAIITVRFYTNCFDNGRLHNKLWGYRIRDNLNGISEVFDIKNKRKTNAVDAADKRTQQQQQQPATISSLPVLSPTLQKKRKLVDSEEHSESTTLSYSSTENVAILCFFENEIQSGVIVILSTLLYKSRNTLKSYANEKNSIKNNVMRVNYTDVEPEFAVLFFKQEKQLKIRLDSVKEDWKKLGNETVNLDKNMIHDVMVGDWFKYGRVTFHIIPESEFHQWNSVLT